VPPPLLGTWLTYSAQVVARGLHWQLTHTGDVSCMGSCNEGVADLGDKPNWAAETHS
jgi:hypothetical protein